MKALGTKRPAWTMEGQMNQTSDRPQRRGRFSALRVAVVLVAIALTAATAAPASAAVRWTSEVTQAPTNLPPGGKGIIRLLLANAGDTASTEMPVVSFELPQGVTINDPAPPDAHGWTCTGSPTVTCTNAIGAFVGIAPFTYVGLIEFGTDVFSINLPVDIAADAPEGVHSFEITASGGGGTSLETHEIQIGSHQVPFGVTPGTFEAGAFDQAGNDYTQAGGHPYRASTSFDLSTRFLDPAEPEATFSRAIIEEGSLKDVVADLPAGFIADPSASPKCADLGLVDKRQCPASAQVGVSTISPPSQSNGRRRMFAVYNVTPPENAPAQLAFKSPLGVVALRPVLRSDGDMGLSAQVKNVTQVDIVTSSEVTLWGVPADPSHDAQRCPNPNYIAQACTGTDEGNLPVASSEPHSSSAPLKPFLSNPTSCSGEPVQTKLHLSSWEQPGSYQADGDPDLSDPNWATAIADSPPITGCDALQFNPSVVVQPTTSQADSPTGLHVELSVPQSQGVGSAATAHLKDTTVLLPEGMTVNPASANGLGACSAAQIGLTSGVGAGHPVFDKAEPSCPLSAKIGTVEVDTPLLEKPLTGDVFLAKQFDNPFGSLLGIYLVVRGPGLLVKLAGHVEVDPNTGRLSTTVTENPQVPFETLTLDLKQGPRAPLMTPGCGTHTTTATLTSWAAPNTNVVSTDSFQITQGPNGGPCPTGKLDPKLSAGVLNPMAGDSSPFVANLSREDGSGVFTAIDLSTPEGLSAKLKGVPYCPEASIAQALARSGAGAGATELASPSCPAASQVGTVVAGAGAGANPFYVDTGKLYFAGPYKGAPLSLVAVIPAVAGPFDLGAVVDRIALNVDPATAQVTAVGDPIPTALQGIPLDVREIRVAIDRDGFIQNPTDCSPMSVDGTVHGVGGAVAQVSNRFQVGGCAALGFKPNLTLAFKGGTKRTKHPALKSVVTYPKGDYANIAKAAVTLPGVEIIDQNHIGNPCTRPQFAEGKCPKISVLGRAKAWSPLLDKPLEGKVYFRANGGERKLPDVVADLGGQIHIVLVGAVDTVTPQTNPRIRTTFFQVPDAPVSRFVLELKGGKEGLLVNSGNICKRPDTAVVRFTGQNGRTYDTEPTVANSCGKKGKARGR